MKKILIIALFSLLLGFNFSYAADQDINKPNTDQKINKPVITTQTANQTYGKLENPLNAKSVEGVILLAVDIAIYVGISFAILAIIFVGFTFVMAQGKPEEIKKAREWLLYIIIGLAILISARVVVDIVINTLEKSGVVKEGILRK